jgi:hypothetical protein
MILRTIQVSFTVTVGIEVGQYYVMLMQYRYGTLLILPNHMVYSSSFRNFLNIIYQKQFCTW